MDAPGFAVTPTNENTTFQLIGSSTDTRIFEWQTDTYIRNESLHGGRRNLGQMIQAQRDGQFSKSDIHRLEVEKFVGCQRSINYLQNKYNIVFKV